MDEQNRIEIRSNEVQEILGGVPSKLVRYGIMLVTAVFLLLLLATWGIKYPDVIRSKIVVTTERPPASIVARSAGKIERLFIADNGKVESSQVLGVIESTANFEDVNYLKNELSRIRGFIYDAGLIDSVKLRHDLQLGSIQGEYSSFVRKLNDFKAFIELDYYPKLNESLEDQKRMSRIYYDRLFLQKNTYENEYELARNQFARDSTLYQNNVKSAKEYEESKALMLSKKNSFEGARTRLAETQMEIYSLDQKIIENRKNHIDRQTQFGLEVSEAYQNLLAAITQWELDYLLKAPVGGVVTFNKFWSETQNVREGDRVLTVVPEDTGELIGKVELPVRGSGKVKTDLKVNIKFDNYPYMEYGFVRGQVSNISLVPEDNFYMVEVSFPDGLVTTYGRTLDLQNQIKGDAEIITEELRFLQRIFNPLKVLWQERITARD